MAKTLKVAVVGMGHGRAHVRVFNEYIDQTEVVMVCDVVEERARAAAEEHGIGKWTTRYADVLAEKDVDLVALCTPCHLHGKHTLAALDHWKHVMVEVPMENQSLETLWKIVYMSERRNLKVQMDNQLRWMAPTVHMKRLIEQGKLGENLLCGDGICPRHRGNYRPAGWFSDLPMGAGRTGPGIDQRRRRSVCRG